MAATDPFVFYTELALGATVTGSPTSWSWTDTTDYVGGAAITINRGRSDRYTEASADRCSLTFLNNQGRFVPRNPLSPYYGQLRRGTPLRVLIRPNVNSASDAFGRTVSGGLGTADSGGAWSVIGAAGDYAVSTANGGRMTQATANVQHVAVLSASVLRVDLRVRVRVNALSTAASQTAGVVFRYSGTNDFERAVIDFAPGGAMTVRVVHRVGGVETPGTAVSTGLTHSASTWYWLRLQTGYNAVRAKVWTDGTAEPATWQLGGSTTALTVLNAGQFGAYGRRETGNTNASATTDFDDFSMVDAPRTQFTGFVDEWPVTWGDGSLTQSYAPVTASGQLRRLERSQPLKSAIYRAATALPNAVAYWPMEDGSKATTFASGLPGGLPGGLDRMSLASSSDVDGSEPLPTFSTNISRAWFPVATYASSGAWTVAWLMKIPATAPSGNGQILSWITPGSTVGRWALTLIPGSPDTVRLDAYSSAGVLTSGGTFAFTDVTSGAELTDGRQVYFIVSGAQNGGNVDTSVTVFYSADADGVDTAAGRSDSFAGTTGRISYIYHDANTGFTGAGHTLGHVLLGNDANTFVPAATSVNGGAGDTTGYRFTQLLATQGIVGLVGDLVRGQGLTTQRMGPMRTGDVLSQLREVEATESGVMHDSKQGFLELLTRAYRQARPVDLALDVDAGDVGDGYEPTDDGYLLQNSIAVTDAGGSTAVATDPESIAFEGVHPGNATVSVYRGIDLQQHAEWRKNLGTTGAGLRYPQIEVNLTLRHLALAMAWLDTDIGSRVTVTNVPSNELPPEDLDLLVDGYEETISSTAWTVKLNCSPGSQWLATRLDLSSARLDCGASTTAAALTTTATNMLVAWADSCNWTHVSGDYDIVFGGESATVTAVDNAVRDTFTRSASSGWGTSDSGHVWTVGAGTASLFSATGSVGQIAVSALNTEHHISLDLGSAAYQRVRVYQTLGVTPTGAGINWGAVLRRTDASNLFWIDVQVGTDSSLTLRIISKIAGANVQLASAVSATTHSTTVARILVADIDASNTIRAKVYSSAAPEPTWELVYDASAVTALSTGTGVGAIARLMTGNTNAGPVNFAFDNFAVLNPQALTVTRSTNGVVKPHAAGEEVHVANPIILAL